MKVQHLLGIVVVGLWLQGCGPSEEASEAAPVPQAAAPSRPVSDPLVRMANAVSETKTGAAVDLKYEILTKPAVGTPIEIEIALVPTADADTLIAAVGGMPGLTLSSEAIPPAAAVKSGEPVRHKLTAVADGPGIYYVSVTVTTDVAGATQARTFSIPLLIGDLQAAQKATVATPPAKDATGQAIQPMPAVER